MKLLDSCQYTNQKALICGITILTSGLLLLFTKPLIFDYITDSILILTPQSILRNFWIKYPIPIPTDIYFFNWTNPEEFFNTDIKPKFDEIGPYRFLQATEKLNVTWNENKTVTFKLMKSFFYDTQMPNCNMSDQVTCINFINLIASSYAENWNIFVKRSISILINTVTPKIHLTRTVKELIEGLDDAFLNLNIIRYIPSIGQSLPNGEKIGLIATINGSSDFYGEFNMATGENGDYGIRRWKYFNKTPYFKGSCANIGGTLGDVNGKNLNKDYLVLFVPEICRYVKFDYEEEVIVEGIIGHKYRVGESILDNGSTIVENKCYCNGECIPSGVFSVSSCLYGLPLYLSLPHYYFADPVYYTVLEGMEPNKSKHESYIVIEPNTGIPLTVSVGVQLNFRIRPVHGIDLYEDVRNIFLPLCWIKQSATLDDSWILLFKIYLKLNLTLTCISIGLIAIGIYISLKNCGLITHLLQKHGQGYRSALEVTFVKNDESGKQTLLVLQK